MKEFSRFHPLVILCYFTAVISFSMVLTHPIFLTISVVCSLCFCLSVTESDKSYLKLIFPLAFFTALVNPLINHNGTTYLFQLPWGNFVTLEAVLFGIAAAAVLTQVVLLFSCFSSIFTSEKFMFVFGRILPSLSLILSMVLRFVPLFKSRYNAVSNARKSITPQGLTLRQKMKFTLSVFSATVGWSLENAIETGDSMKARGYGLKGRSMYSNFTFTLRDFAALVYILIATVYVLTGTIMGAVDFVYYPQLFLTPITPYSISIFSVYTLLFVFPFIIETVEAIKWKKLKSKI